MHQDVRVGSIINQHKPLLEKRRSRFGFWVWLRQGIVEQGEDIFYVRSVGRGICREEGLTCCEEARVGGCMLVSVKLNMGGRAFRY